MYHDDYQGAIGVEELALPGGPGCSRRTGYGDGLDDGVDGVDGCRGDSGAED